MWVAGVLLPLGVCALVYVWLHVEGLRVGYRIHALEEGLAEQVELERRLGLEAAYLESPARVESRARRELGLVPLDPNQMFAVEKESFPKEKRQ